MVFQNLLFLEFPLWLSGLRTWHSVHKDASSIPGLTQWVKDLALSQAMVWVADAAQICSCCGSGVGQRLQLRLDRPLAWEPPYAMGAALEKPKKKKKKKPTKTLH